MILPSTNFNDYNALTNINPVIIVKLGTYYFTTGTFSGITSDYKRWICHLKYNASKWDITNFSCILPTLELTVLDYGQYITTTVGAYSLLNQPVVLYYGFQETGFTDFIQLAKFVVTETTYNEGSQSYTFKCQWLGTALRSPLFRIFPKTTLEQDLGINDLASESLINGDFGSVSYWNATGDFIYDSGNDEWDFTYNIGTGQLAQDLTDFVIAIKPGYYYTFSYTVKNISGAAGDIVAELDGIVDTPESLDFTAGTHTYRILVSDVPGASLEINITTTGTVSFSIDDVSLKQELVIVGSISDFTSADNADWGDSPGNATYIKINDEILKYTDAGTSPARFTVTRAQLGTKAQDHKIGDIVQEVFVIPYHPYWFLLQLFQTDSGGTFDCDVVSWGMDSSGLIDEFDVRNDFCRWVHPEYTTTMHYWYVEETVKDALEYLVHEILRFLPGLFTVNSEGLLTVRSLDLPLTGEGDYSITESNSNAHRLELKVNDSLYKLNFYSDWDISIADFAEKTSGNDPNIILNLGKINQADIEIHDINALSDELKTLIAKRYFSLMGYPLAYWSADTFLNSITVETGDIINITNSKLPLFVSKTIGWTNIAGLVIGHSLEFQNDGSFKREIEAVVPNMFATSISGNTFAYAVIDDTTMTVTTSASDATGLSSSHRDYGMFTIEADLPGGTSTEESINVTVTMTDTPAGKSEAVTVDLVYDARKTGTKRWQIRCETDEAVFTPTSITVTWNSQTAAAGDRLTNVELIKYKLVAYGLNNIVLTDL